MKITVKVHVRPFQSKYFQFTTFVGELLHMSVLLHMSLSVITYVVTTFVGEYYYICQCYYICRRYIPPSCRLFSTWRLIFTSDSEVRHMKEINDCCHIFSFATAFRALARRSERKI